MAKLNKVLTYKKWQKTSKGMGFSELDRNFIESEWGQPNNSTYQTASQKNDISNRKQCLSFNVPRRINTPDGATVRISDVISGHIIVCNNSNSTIGLVDLRSFKMVLQITQFPKGSSRRQDLCCSSCNGSYVLYKPSTAPSEVYVVMKNGSTFSSKVLFRSKEKEDHGCSALAPNPCLDNEQSFACIISNESGSHPAMYDVTTLDLIVNKQVNVSDHMIKYSRDGSHVIAMATDEQTNGAFENCHNIFIMTSQDLTLLFKCPLIPTMSWKNVDVIPSICGFKFTVFGNKRHVRRSNDKGEVEQRPLTVRCWRHLCPVTVTVYKVASPEISLTRQCLKVISANVDFKNFDCLPLPNALISMLKCT